jgi:hypothetical protein
MQMHWSDELEPARLSLPKGHGRHAPTKLPAVVGLYFAGAQSVHPPVPAASL